MKLRSNCLRLFITQFNKDNYGITFHICYCLKYCYSIHYYSYYSTLTYSLLAKTFILHIKTVQTYMFQAYGLSIGMLLASHIVYKMAILIDVFVMQESISDQVLQYLVHEMKQTTWKRNCVRTTYLTFISISVNERLASDEILLFVQIEEYLSQFHKHKITIIILRVQK